MNPNSETNSTETSQIPKKKTEKDTGNEELSKTRIGIAVLFAASLVLTDPVVISRHNYFQT